MLSQPPAIKDAEPSFPPSLSHKREDTNLTIHQVRHSRCSPVGSHSVCRLLRACRCHWELPARPRALVPSVWTELGRCVRTHPAWGLCARRTRSRTSRLYVIAFLWGFVQYEAKGRVSAEAALRHAYFKSLGERVHLLPDSKCSLSSWPGDMEPRASAQPGGGGLRLGLFGCPLSLLTQRCPCSRVGWVLGGCESKELFWVGQRRVGVREKLLGAAVPPGSGFADRCWFRQPG